MEKVVGAGTGWGRVPLKSCVAVAFGCCAISAAWAQEAAQEVMLAEARADKAPMILEINTSTLPRLDAQDSGFQAPRVDLSVLPAGGKGLGLAIGMSGFNAARGTMLPSGYAAVRPSVDVGLTFRHAPAGQNQVDVSAWKRMASEQDAYTQVQMREPVYGARVEMKLSPVRKARFSVDRGFIGMQLESGARISIKRKDGRPMVYYRSAF